MATIPIPPAPGQRGGGAPFVQINQENRGPPPGTRLPGPGQGPLPLPPGGPIQKQRYNSIQYVDLTPRQQLTEEVCRKKLTTYTAITLRKQPPLDSKKDKPTWAKTQVIEMHLAQDDLVKQIKKLNEHGRSVTEKKAALSPFQLQQVTNLLDNKTAQEIDSNFEWSLAQLESKIKNLKHSNKAETISLTVYLKRAPFRDVSAMTVHAVLERQSKERNEMMLRPPLPPPLQPPPMPPNAERLALKGPFDIGKGARKHLPDDSSDSELSSDSESWSSGTRSTEYSSEDSHRQRKYAGRSHSRHREHRKVYGRIHSPERHPEPYGYQRPYEVARFVPAVDPVSVAYQAGKADAEAERLEKYPPRRVLEPPTVISYGPRLIEERYDDIRPRRVIEERYDDIRPRRVIEERYDDIRPRRVIEERYDEIRPRRVSGEYYRQRREAEEYMDARRPVLYYEEPAYSPLPLRPRRYASSY